MKTTSQRSALMFIIFLLILSPVMIFGYNIILGNATSEPFPVDSSVTYQIDYSIKYQPNSVSPSVAKLWASRINNWSSEGAINNTILQESDLIQFKQDTVNNIYNFTEDDVYNNSYDYLQRNFGGFGANSEFLVEYSYETTLYSRVWDIPIEYTMSKYEQTTAFYKFYTQSLPYCEANDSAITALAQALTVDSPTIVEKAREIYKFIIKNITYQIQDEAIGAKQALTTKIGDCSEFSSLMVALLRASGIPARKVLGIGIVEGDITNRMPKYDPMIGDVVTYNLSTIPGHAWVQYYIPDFGWVSCDPTWGQSFYQNDGDFESTYYYFNRIDYVHMITTVGDWYGDGIIPALEIPGSSETHMPEFLYTYFLHSAVSNTFEFEMKITILNKNLIGSGQNGARDILIVAAVSVLGIVILYFALKPSKKKQSNGPIYQ